MNASPAMNKELPAEAIVIGGGPAGLRAAEILLAAGRRVDVYDQKPSVGRKFLVAGRGGLNLTHSESISKFVERYETDQERWRGLLTDFSPENLRAWAKGLGVETYVGTSGRVFPQGQQAATLLRRWVLRLKAMGVVFHVNHRLTGLQSAVSSAGWQVTFQNVRSAKARDVTAHAIVLALGGASWPETGSDGQWQASLRSLGLCVVDWQPANCGFEVAWNKQFLAIAEGQPLKNVAVSAGARTVPGELLVTRYGLEGGALYQLGRILRSMRPPHIWIDFKPGVSTEQLLQRIPEHERQIASWRKIARSWRLGTAAAALLEFHRPKAELGTRTMSALVKRFPLTLLNPRPVAEAISSAGGISWQELDEGLMTKTLPGVFAAGEMIDWEAPTGGYLLQGCFATGTRAGQAAASYLETTTGSRPTLPSNHLSTDNHPSV